MSAALQPTVAPVNRLARRVCSKCQQEKALDAFRKGRCVCKVCQAAYDRDYFQSHRQENYARKNAFRKRQYWADPEASRKKAREAKAKLGKAALARYCRNYRWTHRDGWLAYRRNYEGRLRESLDPWYIRKQLKRRNIPLSHEAFSQQVKRILAHRCRTDAQLSATLSALCKMQ